LSDTEYIYILDVIFPKELAQKLEVEKEVSFGSSRDCDIAITGQGLSPLQGKFRYQNEILTYTQMSNDEIIKIGNQTCKKGRMYILEKGDRVTTQKKDGKEEKLKIIIRKEEYIDESDEVENSYNEETLNDRTDPSYKENSSGVFNIGEVTGVFKNPNQKGIKKTITKFWDYIKEKTQDFFEYIRELNYQKVKEATQVKFSMKERQAPPKQIGKKKTSEPVAGLLPRFLGMFYNVLIFVLYYFQGLPALEEVSGISFSTLSADLHNSVLPFINKIPLKIELVPYTEIVLPYLKECLISFEHFNLFVLFATYELITHFILGVGLGQYILGLRAKGNFLLVRILSPIRLIIYALTFPLIILDIPVILNKKSFKELITLTGIVSKSKKVLIFNSFVLIPLILILFSNIEIILNLASGHPVVSKEVTQVRRPKANENKGEALFKINSPSLMLHANAALDLSQIMIPTIKMRESRYYTRLLIYGPKEKFIVKIDQSQEVIAAADLFKILRQDPMNIGTFEQTNSHQNTILSVETDAQIMQSLYEVITFDIKNPLPLIEKVGIVSNPYQKIYRRILDKLAISTADKSILYNGIYENLITIERVKTSNQLSLLNLTSHGLMETRFEFDPKIREKVLQLIEKSWAAGRESSTEPAGIEVMTKLPKEQKPNIILGAFSSVSSLNKILELKALSGQEITNLTNTFLQLSFHSLKTEDQMLQNTLLDELESLDKWLLVYDKKNKKQSLSDFRLGLLRIQKALSNKNESFFELNK